MSDEYTRYLVKAEHFDFDQTVTGILAMCAVIMCMQDSLLKLLNTLVFCFCCGNDEFSCSSKLWKLLIAMIQFLMAITVLYTLYEFDFNNNHIDNNVSTSNTGYDFDFVCKNTNIVDYVNSLEFLDLRYENLLLLWLIAALTNLNYFLEGGLQCSIDNHELPREKRTNKPKILGFFAFLYVIIQVIIVLFMFPSFCKDPSRIKYAFVTDAVITFVVLVIYFSMVPRVSRFDCAICSCCRLGSEEDLNKATLFGWRAAFVIFFQLCLIFYVYYVVIEFDTIVGILLWLSSLSVRILIYFVTPEHEITQWFKICCAQRTQFRQNRHDPENTSMGSGIELTLPKRPTGAFQPISLPKDRGQPLSTYDGAQRGSDTSPLKIPNYDDL